MISNISSKIVKDIVGNLPYMTLDQAEQIIEFINQQGITNVLELGFAYGVSTCYIASALAHTEEGHITTIDLESAKKREPNVDYLLSRLGLQDRVTVFYEPTSYIWRLMKFLEEKPRRQFDLCYIDGAHSWFVDGFGFYLVDLLLKNNGWIIFDDLNWTFASSPALGQTDWVQKMPEDEKTTPQIRKVYDLLVKPNQGYRNFQIIDGWAYAQKKIDVVGGKAEREIIVEKVIQMQKEYLGVGWFLMQIARRITGKNRKNL